MLPGLGVIAHENTVSKVMKEPGNRAKGVRPAASDDDGQLARPPASPDLLGRDFAAEGPNRKWRFDITYIPTERGFLCGLSGGPR